MSSPVLFSLKANLKLDRNSDRSLYLQLTDQLIGFIKSGKLPPGAKLPSTRKLGEDLKVHRKTIIAAYDELLIQTWLISIPAKGTYVNSELPLITPRTIDTTTKIWERRASANFTFNAKWEIPRNVGLMDHNFLKVDDGVPDHRLAPIDDIVREYRRISRKQNYKHLLTYNSPYGNRELREVLVDYLNKTRGLHIGVDNILITRGSQMGIYLASQLILFPKAKVIVGSTNYRTADTTFENAGAILHRVSVDTNGLDTEAIETYCKTHKVAAVYVTSHHHHPTTVTLSAQRRMHLLELAHKYHFAILEDDYDYDFHYNNAPILPLASNDYDGSVIYMGAFTKMIAPALRIGYFIAAKEVVDMAAKLRYSIDRQGDTILEQSLANLLKLGDIQRQTTRVLKLYKERRDMFCELLVKKLGSYLTFEPPNGGMAVWVKLKKEYCWDPIIEMAKEEGLLLGDWRRYDVANQQHNGIRMGFASLNTDEMTKIVNILGSCFKKCYP